MKKLLSSFLKSPQGTISLLGFMVLVFLYVAGLACSTDGNGMVALIFIIAAAICGDGIQQEVKKIPKGT